MEDKIVFRVAEDKDVEAINTFYNSLYISNRDRIKFEWEFNSSPAGKVIYVVAECEEKIIGTQCVIPYYLTTHANEIILSGKSEDTLVSPEHRGKNIFEKMYALLLEECKKKNITCIWGFTYAARPFLKLNFQIPFHAKMGIFVNSPLKASSYLTSLSPKSKFSHKAKIVLLSLGAWLRSSHLKTISVADFDTDTEKILLNTADLNYIKQNNTFGLKLDNDFMGYRITNNPYSQSYKVINYRKNGHLLISVLFNITPKKVGYLIHLHISDSVTKNEFRQFIRSIFKHSELQTCHTIRFWGFDHTLQNCEEIKFLTHCGFTFINRGISFVWLPLEKNLKLDPMNFVLSRMSSQGTD